MELKSCCCLVIAAFSLQIAVSFCDPRVCPDLTATFVGVIDQTVEDPLVLIDGPEQVFFKEILGFRDDESQHAFDDALINKTYGPDFSSSLPNERNEYFFGNAKLRAFCYREDVQYKLISNNWIQTGNTCTTCRDIHDGGYRITFSGDQLLHGSYGGERGITAGVENSIDYAFYRIDVCDQSPIIIQFENVSPFRPEPVDGVYMFNFDLYNNVLGHGKAMGASSLKPDPDNPGKFRITTRNVFTFPAN